MEPVTGLLCLSGVAFIYYTYLTYNAFKDLAFASLKDPNARKEMLDRVNALPFWKTYILWKMCRIEMRYRGWM